MSISLNAYCQPQLYLWVKPGYASGWIINSPAQCIPVGNLEQSRVCTQPGCLSSWRLVSPRLSLMTFRYFVNVSCILFFPIFIYIKFSIIFVFTFSSNPSSSTFLPLAFACLSRCRTEIKHSVENSSSRKRFLSTVDCLLLDPWMTKKSHFLSLFLLKEIN